MQLHIEKDPQQLCNRLAIWMADYIVKTLQDQPVFSLVLAGGNTPKQLYALLADSPFREKIPWQKLEIFFGDERYVPFDDARNNGHMAYETLLKNVPLPEAGVHYLRTDIAAGESAAAYEALLRTLFDGKENTFDLVLLGMGDDGHTLSLFPGYDIVLEKNRWVQSFFNREQNETRITLTAPVVNRARRIAFLVTGAQKAAVLKNVLYGKPDPVIYPSQIIQPTSGAVHWFVDEAAAALL